MNLYLVFAGDDLYPDGGWRDFQTVVNDYTDAVRAARVAMQSPLYGCINMPRDWAHVVDMSTLSIVYRIDAPGHATKVPVKLEEQTNVDSNAKSE